MFVEFLIPRIISKSSMLLNLCLFIKVGFYGLELHVVVVIDGSFNENQSTR